VDDTEKIREHNLHERVHAVLFEDEPPAQAIQTLMSREQKAER
jgi:glycerol-3-phosphate dehydrogenase